jgi:uncharacterized protein DUF4079
VSVAELLTAWLHPIAGFLAVGLVVRGATLGWAAQRRGPSAAKARLRHARLMPWVYGLMLLTWAGGVVTVWALRDDLDTAASGHFSVGSMIIALLTAGALLSRRIPTDPRARRLHPWVGAAALLLAGVQVFLGLQIMPH